MVLVSNYEQAKGLSGFLFDVAKGALLGTVGLSLGPTDASPVTRLTSLVGGLVMVYICIEKALSLLEKS